MFDEKLKRKMDFIGLICRPKHRMKNHMGSIGKGSYVLVTSSSNGVSIEPRPCSCCDTQVYISRINTEDLEPVFRAYTPVNRWDVVRYREHAWELFDEWLEEQKADAEERAVQEGA